MDNTFNNLNEKMKNTIDKQISNESSNEHMIHPCTTRPSNPNIKNFNENFKQDVYKLINICYCHVCNHACYKNINDISARLCKYGFPTPLMNKTHFD
jgi:hypothetical protein